MGKYLAPKYLLIATLTNNMIGKMPMGMGNGIQVRAKLGLQLMIMVVTVLGLRPRQMRHH